MKRLLLIMLATLPAVGCVGEVSSVDPTGTGVAGAFGGAGAGANTGTGGSTIVGGTGMAGTGTGSATGTGTVGGAGTAGGAGTGGGAGTAVGGACALGGIPADVQSLFSTHCIACHGTPPITGVPASFSTYAQVTAPSMTDPTKSNAALALARVQDNTKPMPPAPLTRLSSADVATLSAWVSAGTPASSCPDGGVPIDAGVPMLDPFAAAPTCTSKVTWTQGNHGSKLMNPGQACIACHAKGGDGPRYAIAGTLYPSPHEPDDCNGVNGTTGAKVVIVDMKAQTLTLTPDSAGNFYWSGTLALPYLAKITYMGRERAMIAGQTTGDCNGCHTQAGTNTLAGMTKAPGRLLLP
jgi:mono/diheme cytochrome c family protein